MKKLLLILLSLIMCISAFASCDTETDNSSDASTESNSESSVEETENNSDESENVSVNEDSSISDESENPYISNLPYDYVIPEFDKSKVIYNPNNTHKSVYLPMDAVFPCFGVPFDKDKLIIVERIHEGLLEYINSNEIPDDAWFPVCITSDNVLTANGEFYKFDGLPELLERIGFVEDEELNKAIKNPEHAAIGYVNMDMLWKIRRDGYYGAVKFVWYPEKCERCPYDATQNN